MRDDIRAFLAIASVITTVVAGISLLTLVVKRGHRDREWWIEFAVTVVIATLASSLWLWQW